MYGGFEYGSVEWSGIRSQGKTYALSFLEQITVVDTLVKTLTLVKSETITIVDSFSKVVAKVFVETITIASYFIANILNYVRKIPYIGGQRGTQGMIGRRKDIDQANRNDGGQIGRRYD